MTRQLTNRSDDATEMENIPDVFSPILAIQPDSGLGLIIKGLVAQGDADGVPIYADLRNADGEQLPTPTEMGIQFEAPGDDDRTTVTHKLSNIRAYNSLTLDEQQNPDHIDRVKHVLKGTEAAKDEGQMPQLGISDVDTAYVSIECSDVINWDESAVYIDRNAVSEV